MATSRKRCTACGEDKRPAIDFYLSRSKLYKFNDGRMPVCKECLSSLFKELNAKYSDEVKNALRESAKWIQENTQNHKITIVPFQNYQTQKAIKIIKKYAAMGVKYFMLDTFKMDAGNVSEKSWLQMQQSMVDINDVVKPEANN